MELLYTELEKTVRVGCGKGRNQQFSLGHVEIPIRDLSRCKSKSQGKGNNFVSVAYDGL